MASTDTTAAVSSTETPTNSRKRPAEDEPSTEAAGADAGGEGVQPAAAGTDAGDGAESADANGEEKETPAKRARTEPEEGGEQQESQKEEDESEDTDKKEDNPLSKLAFLPTVGEGSFSSFSSAAPLSFSSVLSDSGPSQLNFTLGSAPTFNIDFSSPTPFGSLFATSSAAGKDSSTPALTSTGFSLFSSSATSSSSSSSSSFTFSIGGASSLLFSQPSGSSAPVADKVEVLTGEENEDRVHSVRAKLFKLDQDTQSWKEKGAGQLHLNVAKDRSYSRLVMRAEGALRLILNAALFPHTMTKRVQEKSVQVSGVEEGKPVLYLLRTGRREEADDLYAAINRHREVTGAAEETK